jgi:hypothetical protein
VSSLGDALSVNLPLSSTLGRSKNVLNMLEGLNAVAFQLLQNKRFVTGKLRRQLGSF